MPATATATATLPATRKEVPASLTKFSVSSMKEMDGWDGVAFSANVRLDGHKGIVGRFYNEGCGGPTMFRDATREVQKVWDDAVNDSRPLASAETFTYVDMDGNEVTETMSESYADEAAPEWLMAEYETAKVLNRYLKKGQTSVMTEAQQADGGTVFVTYRTTDLDRVKAAMANSNPGESYSVWTSNGWVEVNADA